MGISLERTELIRSDRMLLQAEGLSALGSRYTDVTAKIAVWAAIVFTSWTLVLPFLIYFGYNQYLRYKAIKVIREDNLAWIHEKYFKSSTSVDKEQSIKILLEKLQYQKELLPDSFIEENPTAEEALEKLYNLYLLPCDFLKETLSDTDKKVISDFFLSKDPIPPFWTNMLLEFISLWEKANDSTKQHLQKAFVAFNTFFSPFSTAATEEALQKKQEYTSLFTFLLKTAPVYAESCICFFERLEEPLAEWEKVLKSHTYALQVLHEHVVEKNAERISITRGMSVAQLKEKAEEKGKETLQKDLEKTYGIFADSLYRYFWSTEEENKTDKKRKLSKGIISFEQSAFSSLSHEELTEKLFSESEFTDDLMETLFRNKDESGRLLLKELFSNKQFTIHKKTTAANLLNAVNDLKSETVDTLMAAKIVAALHYCEKFPQSQWVSFWANNPYEKESTRYKEIAAFAKREESLTSKVASFFDHYAFSANPDLNTPSTEELLKGMSFIEKLRFDQFISFCEEVFITTQTSKERNKALVQLLIESRTYEKLPLTFKDYDKEEIKQKFNTLKALFPKLKGDKQYGQIYKQALREWRTEEPWETTLAALFQGTLCGDELIGKIQEIANTSRTKREVEQGIYWLLMQILPTLLKELSGSEKLGSCIPEDTDANYTDFTTFKDSGFYKILEKIKEIFSTDSRDKTKIENILNAIKDCMPPVVHTAEPVSPKYDDASENIPFVKATSASNLKDSLHHNVETSEEELKVLLSPLEAALACINQINLSGNTPKERAEKTSIRLGLEELTRLMDKFIKAKQSLKEEEKGLLSFSLGKFLQFLRLLTESPNKSTNGETLSQKKMLLRKIALIFTNSCSVMSTGWLKFLCLMHRYSFRSTINKHIKAFLLSHLSSPELQQHFENHGDRIIDALFSSISDLSKQPQLEEVLRKVKELDKALDEGLESSMRQLVEIAQYLAEIDTGIIPKLLEKI